MNFENIFSQVYLGNSIEKWLIAFGIAVVASLILNVAIKLLVKHFKKLTNKTENGFDDLFVELLKKTNLIILFVVSLYIGSLFLNVTPAISQIRRNIIIISVIIQLGFWVSSFISYYAEKRISNESFSSGGKITQIKALSLFSKVFVWIFVVLLIISNLGFNVTTLITGLGIGGIAVALAVQNVLGDLIASLSIILDKPFEVGDFIIVDDLMGNVEEVGMKTTRVRSLSGEQLIFSNNDLLGSRIKNYKRMDERRILFTIGVTYDTPHEKLKKIPSIIKTVIDELEKTRFDRAHFSSYGDFSLNFEIVYYMLTPDYIDYMDAQQEINLYLYKEFKKEGIEFAFPTQTLYINRN